MYSDLQIGTIIVNQKGLCLCYCNTCHKKEIVLVLKGLAHPKVFLVLKGLVALKLQQWTFRTMSELSAHCGNKQGTR